MTNQEAFTISATHLLTQKKVALEMYNAPFSTCQYHTVDGLKCAIGVLIPDTLYTASMEGLHISDVLKKFQLPELQQVDITLLRTLQRIHDSYDVGQWEQKLETTATYFNLTMPVV